MKIYTREEIYNLVSINDKSTFRIYLNKDIFPFFCHSALDVLNTMHYTKQAWDNVKIVKDSEYKNYIENKIREKENESN